MAPHSDPRVAQKRVWEGYARAGQAAFSGATIGIPTESIAFAGLDTAVLISIDPAGAYRGWIATGDEEAVPTMIEHHKIFEVAFPYGSAQAVAAGQGEVVALEVVGDPGRRG